MPLVTQRVQYPIPFGNPLDESSTPRRVGDNGGITASSNVIYRRGGAYGSRPGYAPAYTTFPTSGGPPLFPSTGIRWYKTTTTQLTQTVIATVGENNSFLVYSGANPSASVPPSFTQIATTTASQATWPVSFAPVYDPVTGQDQLIICGGNGFCPTTPGYVNIQVATVSAGDVYTLVITDAAAQPTTITYTATVADNIYTVASQLATLANQSTAAYFGSYKCLSTAVAYTPQQASGSAASLIVFTALNTAQATATVAISGGAGYMVVVSAGGGFTASSGTMGTVTSFPTGPCMWNGTTLTAVSNLVSTGAIALTNVGPATGPPQACVNWHNHIWYWGALGAPNYLFASDINNPQMCAFMIQNGGYQIGLGDGDPGIMACVPLGNTLYIFKRNSIYAMTGYDFQSGEYSFSISPVIQGHGIPGPGCVTALRSALVFWDGSTFRRLAPGALETEDIGLPIALLEGNLATTIANKNLWSAAGSFGIQTNLAAEYASPTSQTLNNIAYFVGSLPLGYAVIAYDDDASNYLGAYAWSQWTAPNSASGIITSFFRMGGGADSTNSYVEPPYLLAPTNVSNSYVGCVAISAASLDLGTTGIPTSFTTGWITGGAPALSKELHQIYLEVSATPGIVITVKIYPSAYKEPSGIPNVYPAQTINLYTTVNSIGTNEQYQVLLGNVQPFLRANAFQFTVSWTTAAGTQCEVVGMTLDFIEQTFVP